MKEEEIGRRDAEQKPLSGKQPSGEFAIPQQIGAPTAFLCSEFAANITGGLFADGWSMDRPVIHAKARNARVVAAIANLEIAKPNQKEAKEHDEQIMAKRAEGIGGHRPGPYGSGDRRIWTMRYHGGADHGAARYWRSLLMNGARSDRRYVCGAVS